MDEKKNEEMAEEFRSVWARVEKIVSIALGTDDWGCSGSVLDLLDEELDQLAYQGVVDEGVVETIKDSDPDIPPNDLATLLAETNPGFFVNVSLPVFKPGVDKFSRNVLYTWWFYGGTLEEALTNGLEWAKGRFHNWKKTLEASEE